MRAPTPAKLLAAIALAAVLAALTATAAPAIVPPTDCGPMEVQGKRYKIKADQLRCKPARVVRARLPEERRPAAAATNARRASRARSSRSAASRASRSSSESDAEARPARPASCLALAGAAARGRPLAASAAAHGLVQRANLPIPEWLFAWAAALVLIVSFVALAVLWPKPRLEDAGWRPLPGIVGRALGSTALEATCGAIGILVLGVVVVAGLAGEQNSVANFTPTFIFITFWVGMAFASVLFGSIYAAFSPWRALGRATGRVLRHPRGAAALSPRGSDAGRPRPACWPSPGSSSHPAGASSRGRWRSP